MFQIEWPHEEATVNNIIKKVIHNFMQCARVIDKRAALMPWDKTSEYKTLNGDEVLLLQYNNIRKYISTTT